ncbi:hypothetical protein OBV_26270 [Oscillibacter valericigenes Sjm18-20]|nr:hypothetical protein OBV_26270 [Oscillibacter valericigenes Sjm18-20]
MLLMKPISVIKENTGVLPREKLEQTGYGMLCQAFAMQILNGMSVTDGLYQQLALEFPEDQEPAAPAENVYRISLNLMLATLRKLEPPGQAERVRTERLLKRLKTRFGKNAELSPSIAPQKRPARQSPAITQNNFQFQALLQLSKTGKDAENQPTFSGFLLRAEAAARTAAGESVSGRTDVSDLGRGGALTEPDRGAGTGFQGGISAAGFPTSENAQASLPADAETVLLLEGPESRPSGKSELAPAKIAADAERALERHLREIAPPQKPQTSRETKRATQKAEMKSVGERVAEKTAVESGLRERSAEKTVGKTLERPAERVSVRENAEQTASAAVPSPLAASAKLKTEKQTVKPTGKTATPTVPTAQGTNAQSHQQAEAAKKSAGAVQVGEFGLRTADASDRMQREESTAALRSQGIVPVGRDIRTVVPVVEHPMEPTHPERQELTLAEASPVSTGERMAGKTVMESGLRERSAEKTVGKTLERPAERVSVRENAEQTASAAAPSPLAASAKLKTGKQTVKPTGKAATPTVPTAQGTNAQSHQQAEAAKKSAGAVQVGEFGLRTAAASDRMQREESTAALRSHGIVPVGRDIRTAVPVVEHPMEPTHPERQELTLAEASPVSTGERMAGKTVMESGLRERSAEKTVGKTLERPAERVSVRENVEQTASAAAPSPLAASAKLKIEQPTVKPTGKAATPTESTAQGTNAQSHQQAEAAKKSAGAVQVGEFGLRTAAASDRMQREESTAALRSHGIVPVGRDIRTAVPVVEHPMEPTHPERQELTLAEASPVSTGERMAGKTAVESGLRERSAEKTVGKTLERPAERVSVRENAEQTASAAAPSPLAASAKLKTEKQTVKPTGKAATPTESTAQGTNAQSHQQAEAAKKSAGAVQVGEFGLRTAAASDRMQREESTAALRSHGIVPVGRDIRTAVPVVEHPMKPTHPERQELTLAEASPVSTGDRMAEKTAVESDAEHVHEHGIRERFTGKIVRRQDEILPSEDMELRLEKRVVMETGFPASPVKPAASMESAEKAARQAALQARSSLKRARRPDASKLNSRAEPRSAHGITQVSRDIRAARRFTGKNPFGAAGSDGPSYADADVPELEFATGASKSRQDFKTAAPEMNSEYVKSLPDWAQNFLKNSRVSAPGTVPEDNGGNPGGMISGTARNISVLPGPADETEQVQWTAPQRRPAELSLRQKEEKQVEYRMEKPSDTEIRHMADKVYKLIEERIRRERRMLDL